jgi:hypothetical protein
MYSRKISDERLSKIQQNLPFTLQRYSQQECAQFVEYTNYLIDKDVYEAAAKRNIKAIKSIFADGSIFKSKAHRNKYFDKEIQERIQNEQIICKWDANYWQDSYYQIKNHEGIYVPYSPLPGQRIWRRIRSDLNFKRLPIKLLDLKGRQQGDTTEKQGLLLQRLSFVPDADCIIASKMDKDTGIMINKLLAGLDRQPFWMRPFYEQYTTGEGYRFDNGSFIDLGYGTQESLGKGQTPTACHLSEIALFKHPESAIDNALFNAMHESEWLLQFLEGTAEARDDWFHKKVKEVIADMARGTTTWYFNFIPWFVRRDLFPTPTYIRGRTEAFTNWIPKPETLAMTKVAENWVKSWKYAREELGSNWKMDKEQMFYYEIERDHAERTDKLAEFLSQKPTTVDEAFQHAGKTLYNINLIQSYERSALAKIPEVYKLKGDPTEVSPNYWPNPNEILEDGKVIEVTCRWNDGIPSSIFQLIQIRFDGWDNFDPTNKFIIWEHPKFGFDYSGAVDTSDGLGASISDNSVININRIGTAEFRDKQVCEFSSPEIPLGSMWPFVLCILTYYSRYTNSQILSCIECNKGYELQNALINRGYRNHYKRLDESSPYQDESRIQKYGFWTDRRSRPELIGHFNTFFLGRHYEIYSPMLLSEVRDLQKVRKPNNELGFSGDKIVGKKDDRILAAAINLYASHRREIAGHERKSWESRNKNEENIIDIKSFKGLEYEQSFEENKLDFGYYNDELEDDEDFAFGSLD